MFRAEERRQALGVNAARVRFRERHGHFESLADIAHLQRPVERRHPLDAERGEIVRHFGLKAAQDRTHPVHRGFVEAQLSGPRAVVDIVGHQQSRRREHARVGRHDHGGHAEFFRDPRRVQRTGAAERHDGIAARIAAPLGRDLLDCAHDIGFRQPDDAVGQFLYRHLQFGRKRGEDGVRSVGIDLHLTAEKGVGADAAPDHMRVGDGRKRPAAPVARGSRIGSRRLRADSQQAAVVDPGDRAAARPHRRDVDDRRLDRQAVDPRHRRQVGHTVGDQRDVGTGPPHIEGDEVLRAGRRHLAQGADHACRGSGEQGGDGIAGHGFRRHPPAVRLHHAEAAVKTVRLQRPHESAEIPLDHRLDIGGQRRRRSPLVLAELACHFMAAGNADLRIERAHNVRQSVFVRWVEVAVEETNGDRIIGCAGKRRLDHAPGGSGVERADDVPIGGHALVDLEGIAPGGHRLRLAVMQVVNRGLVVTLQQHQVPRALGHEKADLGALALEDRVGGNGGAMHEVGDRGDVDVRRGDGVKCPDIRTLRRARHFRDPQFPVLDHDEIGKRTADFHSNPHSPLPFYASALRILSYARIGNARHPSAIPGGRERKLHP